MHLYYFLLLSLVFETFENWNLEFVSDLGQFYKIRRISYFVY